MAVSLTLLGSRDLIVVLFGVDTLDLSERGLYRWLPIEIECYVLSP